MILIIIISIVFVILYIIKREFEASKSHELYKLLDKYGSIQIFDNKGLVAILYKDRTIDWMRSVSIYKMSRIKLMSDRFEEEIIKLQEEMKCH